MKKIFRVSTALFLCFVMLLYTGPMQVAASGLAGTLYQIAGNIGVNASLRAIGVGPGKSPDAFNTLVTNISDALAPASNFITDVLIAGTSGNWLTFLRDTFVQSCLDYIVENRVVVFDEFGLSADFSNPDALSDALEKCAKYAWAACWIDSDGNYMFVGTDNSKGFNIYSGSDGFLRIRDANGWSYYYWKVSPSTVNVSGSSTNATYTIPGSYQLCHAGSWEDVTQYDLFLDSVAPSLDDDPYIPWVENSIFNNGDTFVPVSLPSLDSSVVSSQTQTQAQAGTAADAVVDEIIAGSEVVPDTGTGTIADVIAAIKAIPASLADFFADVVAAVQAIPAAIADIFSPAADPEAYQVDLKDFFPFCIPFDLFDIVTAFAAEPEAPVFEWPISVPRWGFEYTLKVDLQEWEDIASLFRTLELTIFCVGLAIVTREKFLRS